MTTIASALSAAASLPPFKRALILGGARSGKSARAEALTLALAGDGPVIYLATSEAGDAEMAGRIAEHRARRGARWVTREAPLDLLDVLAGETRPVLVDCLTLWLTNWRMPMHPKVLSSSEPNQPLALVSVDYVALLLEAITAAPGPLVLVGNEIGLGVIPMGAEVRAFVDALGLLNQQVAEVCARVTLMAAGLPLTLKAAN